MKCPQYEVIEKQHLDQSLLEREKALRKQTDDIN